MTSSLSRRDNSSGKYPGSVYAVQGKESNKVSKLKPKLSSGPLYYGSKKSIYSSDNSSCLEVVLKFGYSHNYQVKSQLNAKNVQEDSKQKLKRTKRVRSPTQTIKVSFYDTGYKSGQNPHSMSASKKFKYKRAQSINHNLQF